MIIIIDIDYDDRPILAMMPGSSEHRVKGRDSDSDGERPQPTADVTGRKGVFSSDLSRDRQTERANKKSQSILSW